MATPADISDIVRKYLKPVYSYAYRLTTDSNAAEDIAQETFIKVWNHLDRYDERRDFKAWLFTIAHHSAMDYLRKRRALPFSRLSSPDQDEDEAGQDFADTLADSVPLIEEQLIKLDERGQLDQALAKLPPAAREVLTLHYQNELTFAEIAAVLNRPQNSIKSTHHRALITLRKLISTT